MAGDPSHWTASASAAGAGGAVAAGAVGAAPASLAAARESRSWQSKQTVWPCHEYDGSRRPIFRSQLPQMLLGSAMACLSDGRFVAYVRGFPTPPK
jgi:hypothetical protein